MCMEDRTKEEIIKNIEYIIDQYVQPAVEQHGGYIKLEDFDVESGKVSVLLQGSCSGCASSTITLKMGVVNMLKHYVPEVNAVEGMDDPNFNNPYY
jgi:Fe-S cluster biogenesis protein NfuA